MCAGQEGIFKAPQLLRPNGLHWRSTWEFDAGLTGADDKLKREVETTN